MPRGDQLARQWRLLQLLGRPQGLAVEDAARQLGCAVRTIWRDLRVLQEAGFPIYDEREGRRGLWKVEAGFRDRLPVPLSLPEVVALLVSHDLLDHGGAGPFGPAVASALAKIRALLTPRALELVERMRAVTALRDTFAMPADFDAEAYLRGAWGIVRGDLIAVRAVFSRAAGEP